MQQRILLVDSQKEALRSLHSLIMDVVGKDARIEQAASGEEALLLAARTPVDLVVASYRLPGLNGLELVHKLRARASQVTVILTHAASEREAREAMVNAGAAAVLEKPIVPAEFREAIAGCLPGLPPQSPIEDAAPSVSPKPLRLVDALVNFRQDHGALAVLLMDPEGRVLARAGDIPGGELELEVREALGQVHRAGLGLPLLTGQIRPAAFTLFRFGDYDLLFVVLSALHSLVLAGAGFGAADRISATLENATRLANEINAILQTIGAEVSPGKSASDAEAAPSPDQAPTDAGFDALLKRRAEIAGSDVDAYWDQASQARKQADARAGGLSYDQAKKLGLVPDQPQE